MPEPAETPGELEKHPQPKGAEQETRSRARYAARISVACAYLCFTLSCAMNQLFLRDAKSTNAQDALRLAVDSLSMSVVVLGLLLGSYGLVAGIRARSRDTSLISCIGLVLNGGIVFVVVWVLWKVRFS